MTACIRTDNIEFILVEPRNPGNVGAAARAMFNMGLEHLAIVAWEDDADARRTAIEWAMDGEWILQGARRCASLDEAVAGTGLVIALSARRGGDRPPALTREDLPTALARWTSNNRVAFVFGPEQAGLRLEHLRHCTHTLALPTAPGATSINLAQAVLLVAYEIRLAAGGYVEGKEGSEQAPVHAVATREERERLYRHAREALEAVGFFKPHHPLHPLDTIDHLLDRAAATSHEVQILHGMCHKVITAVKKVADEG